MSWKDRAEPVSTQSSWKDRAEPVSAQSSWKDRAEPVSLIISQEVSKDEIAAIAARHGVDPEFVSSTVNWYGGTVETQGDSVADAILGAAKQTVPVTLGKVGQFFGGAPQFAWKKLQSDPKKRAAMDEVKNLVREKRSWSEAGAEVAGQVAVSLGVGAGPAGLARAITGSKYIAPTIAGATYGVALSDEGQELEQALFGAGLGLGLPLAFAGGGKIIRGASALKNKLSKTAPAITDEIRDTANKLKTEALDLEDKIESNLFDWTVETKTVSGLNSRRIELASILAGKKVKNGTQAESVIKKALAEEGEEHVSAVYKSVVDSNYLAQAALEAGAIRKPETWGIAKVLGESFMDARKVFESIERRNKGAVNLLETIDELAGVRQNQYIKGANVIFSSMEDLVKKTRELEPATQRQLYDELRSNMTPTSELGKAWRAQFDAMKEVANARGLPIKQLTNELGEELPYVPSSMLPLPNATSKLMGIMKKKGLPVTGQITKEGFDSLDPEFIKAVEYLSGKKIKNNVDFARAWTEAQTITLDKLNKMVSKASTTQARTGEIPELLLNKDVVDLANNWVHGTLKHIYYREPLQQIQTQISTLRKLGDKRGAEYLERWLKAVNGQSSGLAGLQRVAGQAWRRTFLNAASGMEEGWTKTATEFAGDLPLVGSKLMSMLYGNVLGANPRSMVRNLTQPFVMTGTEIGGTYGQGLALKALAASKNLAKEIDELRRFDLLPEVNINEARNALHDSLSAQKLDLVDKATDKMMIAYQFTDTVNRVVTLNMAKELTKDLLAGNKDAKLWLSRQAPSYLRAIQDTMDKPEALTKLIGKNLLAETQFNYNKFGMSEYGRVMGPFFSMFTKWPTSILGDIVVKTQAGQVDRALMKYAGPLGAAMAFDYLTAPESFEDYKAQKRVGNRSGTLYGDRYKKFVGWGGFRQWTPAYSLAPFVETVKGSDRGLLNPPAAQLIQELYRGLDSKRDIRWDKLGKTYVPFAGYIKVLLEDIPTAITGKKPKSWQKGAEFMAPYLKATAPGGLADSIYKTLGEE